jgi:ech hydrogenase subunit D
MSINALTVAPAGLLAEATRLKNDGYRFVTMSSVELDETNMEILYHFDRDLALVNLRVPVEKGGTLPSLSGLLFGAFLVENEIRDQYALTFDGLVLDYQGKLYAETAQTAASSPFCKYAVKSAKKEA